MLFGSTALLMSLVILGQDSPEMEAAQGGGGPPWASAVANLDLNKTVSDIATTITSQKNREAWVRALVEQLKSKTQGKLNIMVFNMQQGYIFNPPAGTYKFTQANFNGGLGGTITYGIWAFSSGTTFTNQGDGGFINWAFYGAFTRNGGVVTFQPAAGAGGPQSLAVRPQIAGPTHKGKGRTKGPSPKTQKAPSK
jgi:hypothetical protein